MAECTLAEDVFEEWQRMWDETEAALKKRLVEEDDLPFEWSDEASGKPPLTLVGAMSIRCFKSNPNVAVSTLLVVQFPSMEVVFEGCQPHHSSEPALSGYLAFRQAPPLLAQLEKLRADHPHLAPQLLLVDGGGVLHARGCGLAVHIGVVADIPTIGLSGWVSVDGLSKENIQGHVERGAEAVGLLGQSGRHWGMAFVAPSRDVVYVSTGHRVSLKSSVEMVKACCVRSTPEPLRLAVECTQDYMRQMAAASASAAARPATPPRAAADAADAPKSPRTPPNPSAARSAELAAERAQTAAREARSGNSAPASPTTDRASEDFVPSSEFTGSRPGFYYRHDTKGLGYYRDQREAPPAEATGGFVPALGYQGTREGWVFQLGPKGLGYYKDEPPPSSAAVRRTSAKAPATHPSETRQYSAPEKKVPVTPRGVSSERHGTPTARGRTASTPILHRTPESGSHSRAPPPAAPAHAHTHTPSPAGVPPPGWPFAPVPPFAPPSSQDRSATAPPTQSPAPASQPVPYAQQPYAAPYPQPMAGVPYGVFAAHPFAQPGPGGPRVAAPTFTLQTAPGLAPGFGFVAAPFAQAPTVIMNRPPVAAPPQAFQQLFPRPVPAIMPRGAPVPVQFARWR